MLPPATPTVHVFSRCLMTSSGPPSWSIFGMVWPLAAPTHRSMASTDATITAQRRMACPPTTHDQPCAIFPDDYARFTAACRPDCDLNLNPDISDELRPANLLCRRVNSLMLDRFVSPLLDRFVAKTRQPCAVETAVPHAIGPYYLEQFCFC